jgi:hypothetical protein
MSDTRNLLSRAVSLYVGYGLEPYPKEDAARLNPLFGHEISVQLDRQIQQILSDLGQLKPDWKIHSLSSAGVWAKQEISSRYAELDEDALDALEWLFTWWWR